ncbi:MAG: DUF503 domain-containing protein [Fimbriimonadaceae bacterium]|nr:DUF503 domain-containing protein [Fimbriimonadaceae bacterium]
MVVGILQIFLRLPGCRSLKDKRRVLRSLIDRVRRDYQVSIAEVGDNDLWGNAEVGVTVVSSSAMQVESILSKVLDAFAGNPEVEMEGSQKDVERY